MADQHEVEHRKKPIRIIGAAKHQVHARRIAQSVASHFHLAPFQCSATGLALGLPKFFVQPTAQAFRPDAVYTAMS